MSKPRQAAGVVTSEVLDELVAYAPSSSQAFSMNASARAIWELCDGTRSIEDLCQELAEAAGARPEDLRADVQSAVDHMGELGLLTNAEP
jgi:hypothetical protein